MALQDAAGRVVTSYGGLKVTDAHGTVLRSRLVAVGSTVRIVVNDHDATYPITVDPTVINDPTDEVDATYAAGTNYTVTGTLPSDAQVQPVQLIISGTDCAFDGQSGDGGATDLLTGPESLTSTTTASGGYTFNDVYFSGNGSGCDLVATGFDLVTNTPGGPFATTDVVAGAPTITG